MIENNAHSASGFDGLGIAPSILGALKKLGIETPTPIQKKSIPVGIAGQDLIGIAQTGTGKTFAYGIPMIQRLAKEKGKGLILLPTRELALQVEESLKKLGGNFGLRTAALIGGVSIVGQIRDVRRNPHIVVATPGRLNDFIQRREINLKDVRILVLDEADMMFDMGFAPQVKTIIAAVPKVRQTMLFSATMPLQIEKLAVEHMALPVRVEVAPAGTTAERVDQEVFVVRKEDRQAQLKKILETYEGSVLIFSRTKHGAKALTHALKIMGQSAAEIHSNRSFAQRKEALAGFKSGKFRILVATDIAARGIDVTGIELVVNFDLPDNSEDYVHRIGRTGRAGKEGKAISFALPTQWKDIRSIERLINKTIPMTKFAELQEGGPVKATYSRGGRVSFGQPKFGAGARRPMGRPMRRQRV